MPKRTRKERTALAGAFIGNSLEWFDFFVYGTASALVFGPLFFPQVGVATGLLASFATMWVGFLTRPLGAFIFGHLGDKFGRKNVLLATLLIMGVSTTAIGLLPTHSQIGIAAPVLLAALRACQGLAVGGEWGGAVLIATEHAPETRKAVAGSWVQQGSPVGSLLATGSFALVGLLPEEAFMSWGWRLPFLSSIVLIGVGIMLRLRVSESEEFLETQRSNQVERFPAGAVIRRAPLALILGVAVSVLAISNAYFTNTFLLAWATGPLEFDRQIILNILLGASIVQFFAQWVAGHAAERFGRARVILACLGIAFITTAPYFAAIAAGNLALMATFMYLSYIGISGYFAILPTFLASAFSPPVRYSGLSLAYQLCSSFIGGPTALIAQGLLTASGNNPWAIASFYAVLVVITIVGAVGLHFILRSRAAFQRHEAATVKTETELLT
jgi:MFS family permease